MTIVKDKLKEEFLMRAPTFDDIPAVVGLLNIVSQKEIGAAAAREEDLEKEWKSPGFDYEQDIRLVTLTDGTLVGYNEIWGNREPFVTYFTFGCTHPDFQGQGIGSQLLEWAEARGQQFVHKAPPDARVVLVTDTVSTVEENGRLFEKMGFTLTRHFWRMRIDLTEKPPTPQWPEGIRIISQQPGMERAVFEAFREAFRDHYGFVEGDPEKEFERWMHFRTNDPDYDPSLYFLAMDGDEIAGVSLCRHQLPEDPDLAWVNILGVRRPWRKHGLGLALLHYTFNVFYEIGKPRVGLGVDAGSLTGATRLYERAGMYVSRQWDDYEKELRTGIDLRKLD